MLGACDVVTGKKKLTMDQDVPGAVPTLCRMPSTIRGTVVSVNNRAAVLAMPNVIAVEIMPAGGPIVKISGRCGDGRDLRPVLGPPQRARHDLG